MDKNKLIFWTPRILSILFIGFLTLFSFDVFEPGRPIWQMALGFLIHNIPVFTLIIILVISWKREIVGGIVFTLAGLAYTVLLISKGNVPWYIAITWSLTIAGPAFLIGGLFLKGWILKRKNKNIIN